MNPCSGEQAHQRIARIRHQGSLVYAVVLVLLWGLLGWSAWGERSREHICVVRAETTYGDVARACEQFWRTSCDFHDRTGESYKGNFFLQDEGGRRLKFNLFMLRPAGHYSCVFVLDSGSPERVSIQSGYHGAWHRASFGIQERERMAAYLCEDMQRHQAATGRGICCPAIYLQLQGEDMGAGMRCAPHLELLMYLCGRLPGGFAVDVLPPPAEGGI